MAGMVRTHNPIYNQVEISCQLSNNQGKWLNWLDVCGRMVSVPPCVTIRNFRNEWRLQGLACVGLDPRPSSDLGMEQMPSHLRRIVEETSPYAAA